MRKCPKCGSRIIAPILYGYPLYSAELEQKLNEKRLFLGGCCISENNPRYHCFDCGKNVASPPILNSKYGHEDYRDIVKGFRFTDGGFFMGHKEIKVKEKNGKISLDVLTMLPSSSSSLQREMSRIEWKKILNHLYCRLYLHEWKKEYCDPLVLDGEQWELKLWLTNGRTRTYYGSNAFPPYWKELLTVFRPYFEEAEEKDKPSSTK